MDTPVIFSIFLRKVDIHAFGGFNYLFLYLNHVICYLAYRKSQILIVYINLRLNYELLLLIGVKNDSLLC